MILAVRTDKEDAELYLLDSKGHTADSIIWHAHRELSDTLQDTIELLLSKKSASISDITGIVSFEGPGSFTGLRIGITVANTLAYCNNIPHKGAGGEHWIHDGIQKLQTARHDDVIVLPKYGAEANVTKPRK